MEEKVKTDIRLGENKKLTSRNLDSHVALRSLAGLLKIRVSTSSSWLVLSEFQFSGFVAMTKGTWPNVIDFIHGRSSFRLTRLMFV
jgi:hypothetical protein